MSFLDDWVDSSRWGTVLTVALFVGAAIGAYLLLRLLLPVVAIAAKRSAFHWDDIIADRRLRHRISLLAPAVLLFVGARTVADESSDWTEFYVRTSAAVLILAAALAISALLSAANTVYEQKPISHSRHIEAYVQIVQILVFLFAFVLIIARLADQSPWIFVSGLGALTAVLLLIFKDTILAFVASVQLAQSDLVDVGDWIEMPECGADGDVIDIALHTVSVQNFDKTITTIPTHKLVTQSFRNWRGMADSGRRRIKRAINIDLSTIRFLTPAEIEHLSAFGLLREYMARKASELAAQSEPGGDVAGEPRRLTNVGTLRAYIVEYLNRLEAVDTQGATFLVRQLQPTAHGLPLEIYVFAATTEWPRYEAIQADIFDHILAMVPEFGLRVFQDPTTEDFRVGFRANESSQLPVIEV